MNSTRQKFIHRVFSSLFLKANVSLYLFLLGTSALFGSELKVRLLSTYEISEMSGTPLSEAQKRHLYFSVLDGEGNTKNLVVVPRNLNISPESILDRDLYVTLDELLNELKNINPRLIRNLLAGITPVIPESFTAERFDEYPKKMEKFLKMVSSGTHPIPDDFVPYVKYLPPIETENFDLGSLKTSVTPDPVPWEDDGLIFGDYNYDYVFSEPKALSLVEQPLKKFPSNIFKVCDPSIVDTTISDSLKKPTVFVDKAPKFPDIYKALEVLGTEPTFVSLVNRAYVLLCQHSSGEDRLTGLPAPVSLHDLLAKWPEHMEKLRLISVMKMTWELNFSPEEDVLEMANILEDKGYAVSLPFIRHNDQDWESPSRVKDIFIASSKTEAMQISFLQNITVKEDSYHNRAVIAFEFPFQSVKDMIEYKGRYFWLPIDIRGQIYVDEGNYVDLGTGFGLNLCLFAVDSSFEGLHYSSCHAEYGFSQ